MPYFALIHDHWIVGQIGSWKSLEEVQAEWPSFLIRPIREVPTNGLT